MKLTRNPRNPPPWYKHQAGALPLRYCRAPPGPINGVYTRVVLVSGRGSYTKGSLPRARPAFPHGPRSKNLESDQGAIDPTLKSTSAEKQVKNIKNESDALTRHV